MTKTVSELWAASRAVAKHLVTYDEPGNVQDVYDVGGVYRVHVHQAIGKDPPSADDKPLRISYESVDRYSRRQATKVGAVFENIEVQDGRLTIHVDDVVQLLVERVEPVDLARALWANRDVRQAFVDALVTRYSHDNISNAERKAVLAGCQASLHDDALHRLTSAMQTLEHEENKRNHLYHEVGQINATLRRLEVMVPTWNNETKQEEPKLLQFNDMTYRQADKRGDLDYGGKSWEEAREFWRTEALKRFPPPLDPGEVVLDAPPECDIPI